MNYDENVRYDGSCSESTVHTDCFALQTLHQLEEELHLEILPGTEIMADVGSHHFVKSKASPDRVLVPQPSEDSHDPLVRSYQGKPLFFIRLLTISSGDRIGLRCGRLRPSSVFCSRPSRKGLAHWHWHLCSGILSKNSTPPLQTSSNSRESVSLSWVSATSSGKFS